MMQVAKYFDLKHHRTNRNQYQRVEYCFGKNKIQRALVENDDQSMFSANFLKQGIVYGVWISFFFLLVCAFPV